MSSKKGKERKDENSMLRKLIMKCLLVLGVCSVVVGCSSGSGEKFKAELKDEIPMTFQIQVEDGNVVKGEQEIVFKLSDREEKVYQFYLEMLEKSMDDYNVKAGTHATLTSDDKEQIITTNITINFEEADPDEIIDFFDTKHENLLNESDLPSWDLVKKNLEKKGFEITPV